VSQLLQLSWLPRGARITRVASWRGALAGMAGPLGGGGGGALGAAGRGSRAWRRGGGHWRSWRASWGAGGGSHWAQVADARLRHGWAGTATAARATRIAAPTAAWRLYRAPGSGLAPERPRARES